MKGRVGDWVRLFALAGHIGHYGMIGWIRRHRTPSDNPVVVYEIWCKCGRKRRLRSKDFRVIKSTSKRRREPFQYQREIMQRRGVKNWLNQLAKVTNER